MSQKKQRQCCNSSVSAYCSIACSVPRLRSGNSMSPIAKWGKPGDVLSVGGVGSPDSEAGIHSEVSESGDSDGRVTDVAHLSLSLTFSSKRYK